MTVFILIDSAQRVGFHKRLERVNVAYRSLYEKSAESELVDIAPLLLDRDAIIAEGKAGIISQVQKLADEKHAVSLIISDYSADELVAHFSRFHLVRIPGNREMLMRWYDTRVLPGWLEVLHTEQSLAFWEGIEALCYWERQGGWVCRKAPSLPQGIFAACTPIELNQSQYDRLLVAAAPDVAIAELRKIMPDQLMALDEGHLWRFVSEHLAQAAALGIVEHDDQVQYLILALYSAGEFTEIPLYADHLHAQHGREVGAFSVWVSDLPGEAWDFKHALWELPVYTSIQRQRDIPDLESFMP